LSVLKISIEETRPRPAPKEYNDLTQDTLLRRSRSTEHAPRSS
jgi:hypothetical protein